MKHRLLLSAMALLLTATALADVTINETNFPDENFRNYMRNLSYYGKDGVLTNWEIGQITTLYVSNKNIQSLQGIEYLTELKELSCFGNQLTSLDISKNTKLRHLYCYSNQLTALDVSKNAKMYKLECYDNQLTTLNVSGCTELQELNCNNNQLTTLNFSGCTALLWLYCNNNLFTTLDVSGCTALRWMECQNNQLTAFVGLESTAMEQLACSNNQFTTLDVSGCTALTSLSCGGNQLQVLDVSKNIELENLGCSNNQLTTLDLSKNTKLTGISCYCNQIKDAGMDALVESLPKLSKNHWMYVIYYENEGNMMTTVQVAAATAKSWSPRYCINKGSYLDWDAYWGSAPDGIMAIEKEQFHKDKGSVFDLSGRRVNHLSKGIFIVNGHKIVQ